jgi:hypothetical protein
MPAFLRRLGEFTVFSVTALSALGQTAPKTLPQSPEKTAIRLERLPLAFEPNVGQAAAGMDYLIRTGTMEAELSATRMRLSVPSARGRSLLSWTALGRLQLRRQPRIWKASRTIYSATILQTGISMCHGMGESPIRRSTAELTSRITATALKWSTISLCIQAPPRPAFTCDSTVHARLM